MAACTSRWSGWSPWCHSWTLFPRVSYQATGKSHGSTFSVRTYRSQPLLGIFTATGLVQATTICFLGGSNSFRVISPDSHCPLQCIFHTTAAPSFSKPKMLHTTVCSKPLHCFPPHSESKKSSHVLLLPVSPFSPLLLSSSDFLPARVLPQDLCTWYSLCLECSCPGSLITSVLLLLNFAQMTPS